MTCTMWDAPSDRDYYSQGEVSEQEYYDQEAEQRMKAEETECPS